MSSTLRRGFLGKPAAPRVTAGKTRVCPHCKTTILESAGICPACQRYLRFDGASEPRAEADLSPLRVAGTIRHPEGANPWEYSVVFSVRNERGEEITRQVVGVGALNPGEERSFSLTVEVFQPERRGS
jgi:hypothetical protein